MGGIWFEKANALLNLIGHQRDIDKTYLYAQDAYGPKYKLLYNKHEVSRIIHFNDSQAFIEYSNELHDI